MVLRLSGAGDIARAIVGINSGPDKRMKQTCKNPKPEPKLNEQRKRRGLKNEPELRTD